MLKLVTSVCSLIVWFVVFVMILDIRTVIFKIVVQFKFFFPYIAFFINFYYGNVVVYRIISYINFRWFALLNFSLN